MMLKTTEENGGYYGREQHEPELRRGQQSGGL